MCYIGFVFFNDYYLIFTSITLLIAKSNIKEK